MPRADRFARLVGAGLLAATVALSGCSGEAADDRPREDARTVEAPGEDPGTYVSLGDSFTAAPYVPLTDLAEGCLRSSGNYPSLVAEELGLALTDVSCSGADTDDVLRGQEIGGGRVTLPPQVDAVASNTDVVTVGIGGNDHDLFALLVLRCPALADRAGAPCMRTLAQDGSPGALVDSIGQRVERVLRAVHQKAPEARVVLVGYPRLISPERSCDLLPLAAGDRPRLAALESRLNRALATAARATGSAFADLRGRSAGHEICSADPWVNGDVTDETRALAFHPFAVGQEAAADAVVDVLVGP